MPSPSRLPHLVRGAVAATVATFAALFAHMLGGGAPPAVLGVAVPLALSLPVCVLLAGRRLSAIRLAASVLASQALFHTLFVLGTPPGAGLAGAATAPAHHLAHGAMTAPGVSAPGLAAPLPTSMLLHGDAAMWGAHLLGAAATVLFLLRGERAFQRLGSLAERFLAWIARPALGSGIPAAPTRPGRAAGVASPGWSVLSRIRETMQRRRGPPAILADAR